MDNPFQIITDTFTPTYRVNLSIQRLDGSIMLTLSNEDGVVAKRMISAEQRNDPQRPGAWCKASSSASPSSRATAPWRSWR